MATPGCQKTLPATDLSLFLLPSVASALWFSILTPSLWGHVGTVVSEPISGGSVQGYRHTLSTFSFTWPRCTSTYFTRDAARLEQPLSGNNSKLEVRTFSRRDPLGINQPGGGTVPDTVPLAPWVPRGLFQFPSDASAPPLTRKALTAAQQDACAPNFSAQHEDLCHVQDGWYQGGRFGKIIP